MDEIARKRLSVLRLAERIGNAAEACRRSGVDRTSFYQWKRRYARDGVAGLSNQTPVRRSHPHATPANVNRRILVLALAHPAHGCDRISRELARRDIEVSAVTIQKILHNAGLGTADARGAALEASYPAKGTKLSAEQLAFLEHINPSFRDRGTRSSRPGALLCQGSFFLGRFDGAGPLYVHAIVDDFSSYAFAELAPNTRIEHTLAALQNRAMPFCEDRGIRVESVSFGNLSQMSASKLRAFLLDEQIEVRANESGVMSGFVERFRRTAVSEFLRLSSARGRGRRALAHWQQEFDEWLKTYNITRPHNGYPNYGETPLKVLTNGKPKRG